MDDCECYPGALKTWEVYRGMDPDTFSERAASFFPKAKDWPPPERQPSITPEEMVKSEPRKTDPPPQNK